LRALLEQAGKAGLLNMVQAYLRLEHCDGSEMQCLNPCQIAGLRRTPVKRR